MREIFFYIIVPIYNVEKYLRECLDSIKNQTYGNFMAILIDDGSEDSSGLIAESYCKVDSRFILLSQENRGLSMARNAGLEYIKANRGGQQKEAESYIVFVDSDDYLEVDGLEYASLSLQTASPDIIAYRLAYFVSDEVNLQEIFFDKDDENKIYTNLEILAKYPNIVFYSVWLFVYRADFLLDNDCKFEPNIIHEDNLFCNYVFALADTLRIGNKPMYHYRTSRDNSIMNLIPNSKSQFCKSMHSNLVLANRFYSLSMQANNDILKDFLLNCGMSSITNILAKLQICGYCDDLEFGKSDLKQFYPYLSLRYKFCYHFPRIYGFLKRLKLFLKRLIKGITK